MNIQTPVVGKDVSEAVFGQEYNEDNSSTCCYLYGEC